MTPEAADVIQRLEAAEPIDQWSFTYRPDSPSPYLACLQGIDEVVGNVDIPSGTLWLQPLRDAPAVAVTEQVVAVPDPDTGTWLAAPWPTDDSSAFVEVFGETLAGYVVNGLRLPDPNMTVVEMLTVASSVDTADGGAPAGSDTLVIAVDVERFNERLNDASEADIDALDALTVTAMVDPAGRVTTLIVDANQITPGETPSPHGDRYVITADYDSLDPVEPEPTDPIMVGPADLPYPDPQSSCEFRS